MTTSTKGRSKRAASPAPKLGRPFSGEPQREQCQVRLTPAERAEIQAAADREGVKLATWIRQAAMRAAECSR